MEVINNALQPYTCGYANASTKQLVPIRENDRNYVYIFSDSETYSFQAISDMVRRVTMRKPIEHYNNNFPNLLLRPNRIYALQLQIRCQHLNQVVKCLWTHSIKSYVLHIVHLLCCSLNNGFNIIPMRRLPGFHPKDLWNTTLPSESRNPLPKLPPSHPSTPLSHSLLSHSSRETSNTHAAGRRSLE
ncbi:hypothetical protein M758_UG204800 [Ceratodon purpureus]|nr:hypothetical protein M758_UG204800 [Ceratodon purpureus]